MPTELCLHQCLLLTAQLHRQQVQHRQHHQRLHRRPVPKQGQNNRPKVPAPEHNDVHGGVSYILDTLSL